MNLVRSLLYALGLLPGQRPLRARRDRRHPARPRRRCAGVADAWAGFNRFCARFLLGIRTRVEGEVPSGPALVAVKHQSMFETTEIAAASSTLRRR